MFKASVQVRRHPNGTLRWVVRWRPAGAGGPQPAVPFADPDEAAIYALLVTRHQDRPPAAALAAVGLGHLLADPAPADPAPAAQDQASSPDLEALAAPVTLVDACRAYLDQLDGQVLPNTLADYRTLLHRHLVPFFGPAGDVPSGARGATLAGLTRAQVAAWQRWMVAAGRSPKTIKNVRVAVLGPVCKRAARPGDHNEPAVRPDNPCEGIRTPRPAESPAARADATGAAGAAMLAAAYQVNPDAADAVLFMAGTGMRKGEVLGLTAAAVDLDRAVPVVWVETVGRRAGRGQARGGSVAVVRDVKSTAGRRQVPVPADLLPMLAARVELALAAAGPDGLVFPNARTGRVWLGTAWQRFMDRVHAITGQAPGQRVTAHRWRAAYITWMADGGVPETARMRTAGHAGTAIGDRVYYGQNDRAHAQVRAAVDNPLATLAAIRPAA